MHSLILDTTNVHDTDRKIDVIKMVRSFALEMRRMKGPVFGGVHGLRESKEAVEAGAFVIYEGTLDDCHWASGWIARSASAEGLDLFVSCHVTEGRYGIGRHLHRTGDDAWAVAEGKRHVVYATPGDWIEVHGKAGVTVLSVGEDGSVSQE